jgi:hypothetical protein
MIHVLLPAYNEADALPQVLKGIAHSLASGDYRRRWRKSTTTYRSRF